jgi:hypothetical protein
MKCTAWGKDGCAHILIGWEGPPTWNNQPDGPIMEDATELIWTIEANSWDEACVKYHELQGWEPYKPMEK